jgi:hypothetical protein
MTDVLVSLLWLNNETHLLLENLIHMHYDDDVMQNVVIESLLIMKRVMMETQQMVMVVVNFVQLKHQMNVHYELIHVTI